MLKNSKRLWLSLILSIICATLLCCAFLLPKSAGAQIQTDIDDNTKTLKIDELTINGYNTSTANAKVFNKNNLTELYSALTGGTGKTLQAVKDSVTGPEVSYGTTTTTATGAVTIPAYKSAKDLYDLNTNKNIVVGFGGQTWTVTFLTTDNEGDVIATLWLADAYKENGSYVRSAYSWYNATSATANGTASATNYVSNMYASSFIRVKTLNGGSTGYVATNYALGGSTSTTSTLNQTVDKDDRVANPWAIYTLDNTALANDLTKANKSLIDYIDTPSQIKYTYFEDFNYQWSDLGGKSTDGYMLNEAINKDLSGYATGVVGANTIRTNYASNALSGYWYNSTLANVANTTYSNADYGYNSWAYDRIWLPSISETGAITTGYDGSPGIWETAYSATQQTGQLNMMGGSNNPVPWNQNQSSINSSEFCWLRSGWHDNTYLNVYLAAGGGRYVALGSRTLGVRPALHLNLTKADAVSATVLTTPSGTVETTYNGSTTGQSIDTITENIPDWYDSIYYTDPSIITLTYKNSTLTSPVSKVVESGEYTATVTLKDTTNFKWSDIATNSSAERTFTFKVKKKELELEFEDKDGLKVAKFKDENEIYTRDKNGDGTPKFTLVTKYSKNNNAGSATYTAPDSTGDWYAHAFITDTDCNYSVSNTGVKFTINKIVKKYPAVTDEDDLNFTYDGNEHTIYISGYDSELMNYTPPTDIAMSYDEGTKLLSLKVTDAGEYTVIFTLKNTDLYEWESSDPVKITVSQKKVQINADASNPTSWEKDTNPKELKFTVPTTLCTEEDKQNGLNLVAVCTKDGGTVMAVAPTVSFADGVYTVTIPSYSRGNYTISIKVADGENYVANNEVTHSFEITGQGIDVGYTDIIWKINGKNYAVADDTEVVEIEYTGKAMTLAVDFSTSEFATDLELVGDIGGDWATAIEKGDYTATAHIASTNAALVFDKTFTLNIKIVPKVLTFDDAVWQWQYADGEEWRPLTDKTMPPFDNKAVTVRIDPDYLAGLGLAEGDYELSEYSHDSALIEIGDKTTTVVITLKNGNYTTGNGSFITLTKNWKITAKALEYTWTATQGIAVGDNTFSLPAIEFADGKDYSDYYEYYFTVNGVEYTKAEFEEYLAENWTEETPVSGSVTVRMKDGQDEVTILSTEYPFNTGTPKTALTVEISGGGQYGKVEFTLNVTRGVTNECDKTKVTIEDETFDGNDTAAITEYLNTLDAGTHTVTVTAKDGNYTLSKESYELTIEKFRITQDMWNKKTGKIELPEKYKDGLEITYKYFTDEEGTNEVDISTLGAGDKYFVTATISGDKAANFEFDGGSLEDGIPTLALKGMEIPKQSDSKGFLPIIIGVAVGLLLLLALALIIFFVIRRRKRATEYDDEYDDEYDYDDENGEDGENYGDYDEDDGEDDGDYGEDDGNYGDYDE